MILNIFVHEFQYNVGHSRAMIEVLNHMDDEKVESLNIICYEHDNIQDILPKLSKKTQVKVIPGKQLKPFLFKSIYFQLHTSLFFKKAEPQKEINITMGVCSFVGDVVNIQFAHYFWNEIYFKVTNNSFLKTLYKKIYFKYLDLCESYYYRKDRLKFVFLSDFMKNSFERKYSLKPQNTALAYSSANLERFSPPKETKENLFKEIVEIHPELLTLDLNKPTFLFVGAFERKGLPFLLDKIPNDSNFVIVGKPEKGSTIEIPKQENYFYITHTNIVEKFYQCFDIFIFPTLFEPFGLVIIEAAMCGMSLLVSNEKVGASELLENLEGISFIDPYQIPNLKEHSKLVTTELRVKRHEERKEKLSQLTWKNCANEWEKVLNS